MESLKFEIENDDLDAKLFLVIIFYTYQCRSKIYRDTIHRALGFTSTDKVRKELPNKTNKLASLRDA